MGDGTKENPYTREDVQKKINEMKNDFDWVDLSGGEFQYKVDLRGLKLHGFIFRNSVISGAQLEEANLSKAVLQKANLDGANLSRANLTDVNLSEASLKGTNFEGAIFCRTKMHDGEKNDGCN